MSALNNTSIPANKKYHPAGTQVIISFGVHNLLDLQTYITGLISGSLGTATDTTAGSTKVTYNMGSLPRAKVALVSQSGSGATNLLVNPFSIEYLNGLYGNLPTVANPPVFNTVSTGAFTAPVTNPRIDLVVWATAGGVPGTVMIRQGTEGASPTTPSPTDGDIVLCTVFNRVGQTKIVERNDSTNGYIAQWYEPSIFLASVPVTTKQVTFGVDQSQAVTNATYAVGEANATTKHSLIAQSFVPTILGIQGIKLWKIADTGTFTGNVKVSVQADTSGSPSGTDLASYTILNAAWLKIPNAAEFAVSFSTEYESLIPGTTYWLVVTPSTSDNSNHPNLGTNTAGGYAAGVLKFNNSTDGWVLTATTDLYFKTTTGILNKITQTDSTTGYLPINVRNYALIDINTTPVNSSNTNEVTVYSKLLEGGFFTATSGIKITIGFSVRPVGNDIPVRIKYNGTTIATVTILQTNNSSATTGFGKLEASIINTTLSAQNWGSHNTASSVAAAAATSLMLTENTQSGTATTDTSGPTLLEITFQTGTTTNTTWSYLWGLIEKIG